MSEADLELVRRAFGAWGPSMYEEGLLTEDHELRPLITGGDLVSRPHFVGREGFNEYWREVERAWSSLVLELGALHDLADGMVLAEYRIDAVGRASGVPVSTEAAGLFVIRHGRIAITHAYSTLEEARAAAAELRLAVIRSLADAFNRGDADGFVAECDPEVEWYPLLAEIEGPRHGHAGIRAWLRETADNLDDFCIDLSDARLIGDRGLAVGSLRGRGRGSGVPFERDVALVVELQGLRMYRARAYLSEAAALEAVGG
jgi:ketosteroid isomerase-like protein